MITLEENRRWQQEQEAARQKCEDRRDRRQIIALLIAAIGLVSSPILTWFLNRPPAIPASKQQTATGADKLPPPSTRPAISPPSR